MVKFICENLAYANWWAILVSALAAFALGGIWYSPLLFVKTWIKESGVNPDKPKGAKVAVAFGGTFLLQIVAAAFLAALGPTTAKDGALLGLFMGVCFVATAIGTNYLYEGKSLKLFLINVGYSTALLVIMGLILGAWH
jgi:hypothetical protein